MNYRLSLIAVLALTGCANMPMGSMNTGDTGAKTVVTGAAGGSTTANANSALPKCDRPLGTLGVNEDQGEPWFLQFQRDTRLTSTTPLIRLMVQQSNCFVVVERGSAGLNSLNRERAFAASGELRSNSNLGKGQLVAADFTLTPSIVFSEHTGGAFAGVGGIIGGVAGALSKKEASVTLTLIENRSGVQIAASEGSSSKFDFGGLGGLFGGGVGGVFGGYTKTPQGKVITASFLDAYSQMVEAVKNYRQQNVQGGLGTGRGGLQVQGAEQFPANNNVAKPRHRR
jgi:curli biogenesis system outer membrane secretion channel CsgG